MLDTHAAHTHTHTQVQRGWLLAHSAAVLQASPGCRIHRGLHLLAAGHHGHPLAYHGAHPNEHHVLHCSRYTRTRMHTCTHTHAHAHMLTHARACTHAHTRKRMHTCTHTRTRMLTCTHAKDHPNSGAVRLSVCSGPGSRGFE